MKLHIGCSLKHLDGYINLDISESVKPDKLANWEDLPFKDESIDEILSEHTLEHVLDFKKAMKETWRVLKKGGIAKIIVPYATLPAVMIPQHIWHFNHGSFLPFKKGDGANYYYDFSFSSVKEKLSFRHINKVISPLANKFPWLYQNTFLAFLFPANELKVELIK